MPYDTRVEIEARLLAGPSRWKDEDDFEFEKRRAWMSLARITWLANSGCDFAFDLKSEIEKLGSLAPDWRPEYGARAAESMGPHGGWVHTETEYSALLKEPLSTTLSKARELSGRAEDFLTEKDPFGGLSEARPVRAFAALEIAAKRDEYPEWAWRTFLNAQSRKNGKPKFSALIAERIARYPEQAIANFIRPASDWLANVSKTLASEYREAFDRVAVKLINVVSVHPSDSSSGIARGSKEPDWTMEAINAPVGKIAEALFSDPRTDGLKAGAGLPAGWITHVNGLLSLPCDLRRHALVIFAHNLNWFHIVDPNWAEAKLLSVLDRDDEDDRNAFWSGFFWGSRVPNQQLYRLIKPNLLKFAKEGSFSRRGYSEVLAGIILVGWGSGNEGTSERLISNDELRDVLLHADDEFRSQLLWQAERWSEAQDNGAGEKWTELLPELLRDVWPRHKAAKSPTVSARLCDIAFSNPARFPQLAKIVLPLVSTIDLAT